MTECMIDSPCTDQSEKDLLKNCQEKNEIFHEEYQTEKIEKKSDDDDAKMMMKKIMKEMFLISQWNIHSN